ncbi:MAG: hypothetical protein QM770_06260 [Tepidisphaeraceae bacterium]
MPDPQTIPLWNGPAPLSIGDSPEDVPSLTLYRPAEPTGGMMVVCPGGGYGHLANHEGEPFAGHWRRTASWRPC